MGPYKKETLVVMKLVKEKRKKKKRKRKQVQERTIVNIEYYKHRKKKKNPENFQFFTEISTRFGVKVQ